MLRLLLDTDVLLDVALDRAPFAGPATALLNHLESRPGAAFIAWHSAANFYYLVSARRAAKNARDFIKDLTRFVEVAPVASRDLSYALSLDLPDFEDAMQVAAAVACKAGRIVTRNIKHYRKSPIHPVAPGEFLKETKWA